MVATLFLGKLWQQLKISRDKKREKDEESHEDMSYVVMYTTRAKMIDEVEDFVLLILYPS
jgi:hypothetical protein